MHLVQAQDAESRPVEKSKKDEREKFPDELLKNSGEPVVTRRNESFANLCIFLAHKREFYLYLISVHPHFLPVRLTYLVTHPNPLTS